MCDMVKDIVVEIWSRV